MVRRGEVKLDDPVSKYLPASVRLPSRNGREIALLDLATQTSGLPRLPGNMAPKDPKNPYADYYAQITFVKEQGRVTQLVLHQNGRDAPGKRIK
jgi:CubicO group peptidase (beta-lactamase class C family)